MNMIRKFEIKDEFIGRYEKLVREVVIPYQEKALKDQIPNVEKSHCIENFKMAAEKLETGVCHGEFYGMVFQDSDVAKWLEGAAYSLEIHPDKNLQNRCDEIIDIIERAQQKDGYLNTYFTVKEPDKRWSNLAEAHEMYCAGHMIEAAVAYAEATGSNKLLDVMCKMADHIYQRFIVEKTEGYSGHPEIELALMRLYHFTGNRKYQELALHLINVRGVDSEYFAKERKKAGWTVWNLDTSNPAYMQAHAPVRSQKEATGHAVRAVYLYTGMADAAAQTNDESLKAACRILWDNITQKQMYVTGAIGSAYEGEAFTKNYHLPNDTTYGETCASIGLIFFGRNMLKMEKKSKYADVMERALYNCVLAGMELDGTKFFYVNPLEVIPGISGEAQTHKHTLPVRPGWFTCACCPPNVARLLPSLAEYAWELQGKTLYSHLFMGGTLDMTQELQGRINVKTGYPYDGKVVYEFLPEAGKSMEMTLAVRIPSWSSQVTILLNEKPVEYQKKDGYAYVEGNFHQGEELQVEFDMSVRTIYADSRVYADHNKVAFSRGPLVYCAEGVDNDMDVLSLKVMENTKAQVSEFEADKLYGIREIKVEGLRREKQETLYSYEKPEELPCSITLIPYYAWSNRGLNQMRVWLPIC